MSDIEMSDDEAGASGEAVEQSMVFSAMGQNAKGKRSAANLPVELEDSLPWYVSGLDLSLENSV
jgi:replication factor C subunit 3/5